MSERGSETGASPAWQSQPPKTAASGTDRTKTLLRVTSLSKRGSGAGGGSAVGSSRHRGSLLKRRAAAAATKSIGQIEPSKQQQLQCQQKDQQCFLESENSEFDFQQEPDEDLFCAEEPQHQQLQNSLSCGGTALTSASGPGLQLFGGGGGSHLQSAGCSAALQDVSASAILQQHQKQQQQQQQQQRAEQLDVSMLMHSGFYGTREEVEQLLAQAIQLHCRPNSKLGDGNSKAADCWSSLPQQHQPRPGPKTSAASTAGLAEDLLQAWSGGGGSGGKSVHFSLDSPSNTASCQQKLPPPATAATPRPTMRNQLLLTDFSEEETAAEPEAETAVFLTAKPPVPKPRTDRRSASLNRQRAQPAPSGGQQVKLRNCNAALGQPPGSASRPPQPPLTQPRLPVPTPTPRQRRMGGPAPAAASTLRCLPPPQSPPVPRQRRRLSVSSLQGHRQPLDEPCRGLSAYSTPLTQAAESDEVGQHRIDEDNATVKPEFVGTALGQLLQTRLRHSQSFSGGSAGADDEVLRFDLENSLTTARRPQGPKRTASRAEMRRFGQFKRGQQLDNVPGL